MPSLKTEYEKIKKTVEEYEKKLEPIRKIKEWRRIIKEAREAEERIRLDREKFWSDYSSCGISQSGNPHYTYVKCAMVDDYLAKGEISKAYLVLSDAFKKFKEDRERRREDLKNYKEKYGHTKEYEKAERELKEDVKIYEMIGHRAVKGVKKVMREQPNNTYLASDYLKLAEECINTYEEEGREKEETLQKKGRSKTRRTA